jgi:hypothetical protein
MYLSINEKPTMSQLYSFIFHYLEENELKIFRWKLLQYIIPTKKLLIYINGTFCIRRSTIILQHLVYVVSGSVIGHISNFQSATNTGPQNTTQKSKD